MSAFLSSDKPSHIEVLDFGVTTREGGEVFVNRFQKEITWFRELSYILNLVHRGKLVKEICTFQDHGTFSSFATMARDIPGWLSAYAIQEGDILTLEAQLKVREIPMVRLEDQSNSRPYIGYEPVPLHWYQSVTPYTSKDSNFLGERGLAVFEPKQFPDEGAFWDSGKGVEQLEAIGAKLKSRFAIQA